MERGRILFIFKVKCHISRSLGLYKEFWHLDPCGQDMARTIQPRMLKLTVCILYMDRGRSLLIFKVKVHISRSLGLHKEFWHLGPCEQDIARTIQPRMLKLSVCIPYMDSRSKVTFQGHYASTNRDGYLGNFMWFKSNC